MTCKDAELIGSEEIFGEYLSNMGVGAIWPSELDNIFSYTRSEFPLFYPCEINRIHHWCSVGTEKSQPEGPSFPTGTVGPRVGIFLESLNTNDRFFFSYTTTVRYSNV